MFVLILFAGISALALRFMLIKQFLRSVGLREQILWLILWSSALCWIYTEGFSLFDAINSFTARAYWASIFIAELAVFYRFTLPPSRISNPLSIQHRVRELLGQRAFRVLFFCSALIILPLFMLAIFTPPNNFDSNSYHLHRILAWVHYGNVDFFPTTFIQQLYHNVFAEYLVLNVYLVTGSDQLVNLVQFFAGIGCLTATSLLAGQLGLSQRGQAIAAFVLLTLPVGIFELTTTQVDYVACCFFASFLYFGYRLKKQFSWISLIGMSLSLSFGAFTKYPIFFYALPFCIYFGISYLKVHHLRRSISVLLIALTCLIAVFLPFSKRNYELFGNIISPTKGSPFLAEKLSADDHKAVFTLSNLIKNSSLHLSLPYTGFNREIERNIGRIHDLIGVDVNQPEISEDAFSVRYSVHEDMIPNTLHFYLMLLFTVVLGFTRGNRNIKIFWILGICGFLLFCSLLKFQLWSTRTHMPFFVMGSILIGFMLIRSHRLLQALILFSLFASSLLFVFGNPSKPIFTLPYYAKRVSAHIPSVICFNSSEEADRYRNRLANVYDFSESDQNGCYPLRSFPDLDKRRNTFKVLDDLGYYLPIKRNVFTTDRAELYFMNIHQQYPHFQPLFTEITGISPGVGVMSHNGEGFYFYQAALKAATGVDADFNYIFYKKEFATLENTHRPFCYEYVLTDDIDLVTHHFGEDAILRVVSTDQFSLVCLKEKRCDRFLY